MSDWSVVCNLLAEVKSLIWCSVRAKIWCTGIKCKMTSDRGHEMLSVCASIWYMIMHLCCRSILHALLHRCRWFPAPVRRLQAAQERGGKAWEPRKPRTNNRNKNHELKYWEPSTKNRSRNREDEVGKITLKSPGVYSKKYFKLIKRGLFLMEKWEIEVIISMICFYQWWHIKW